MKNSVQLRKVTLLCFSKTHEFCISKAAFTISFFAAVSHNYDHKQWTLKHRNTQNRSKSTYHKSILNPLKQTSNSEGVHWDDWQQRRKQKSAGFWTSEFMRFWKARLSVERKAGGILVKSNLVFMATPLPLLSHSERGKEMTLAGEQDTSKRLLWFNFVVGLIFFSLLQPD